jgi:tetratricopeptide (TPR) repeat protein
MKARGIALAGLLLASCAAPEPAPAVVPADSSAEFERGTAALDAGDLPAAIAHLEKAVELEPGLSRNQNNLASAYLAAGRARDGWPHVRRAVEIDPRDPYAVANCRVFFVTLREETGLANGDPADDLRKKLGDPDEERNEDGKISWRYCLIAVQLLDGVIAGAVDIPAPEPR